MNVSVGDCFLLLKMLLSSFCIVATKGLIGLIILCSYNSTEMNNGADKLAEQRTQLLESRR